MSLSQRELINETITTALAAVIRGSTSGLYGMRDIAIEANFVYGSGGTTAKVWIQTSLDGGANWIDICNFAFTTSSARLVTTLSVADAAATITPVDGTLADNTEVLGILGDMIRAKLTTTGTYAGGTTLNVNYVPQG